MKNILIVEKSSDIGTNLVSFLGKEYQVNSASTREDALKYLGQKEADILIVDVEVPVVKSLQLIQEAKNIRPDLAVVAIYLCFDQTQDVEHILRKAADICIRKPIDDYEIISKAIKQLDTKKE